MSSQKSKGTIFEKLDIFGTPINIRFNDMDTHKTFIGAFATFVIIGALIFEVFYVLVDLINYTNVSVIFQEEIVSVPNRFEISPKTFQFAISMLSDNLVYITDEEVFKFEAVFQVTNKIFNTTSNQYQFITKETPFQLVQCTPEHFQMENIKQYFLSLPYQKLFCFDTNMQLELQGQYGAQIYKRMRIRIKECDSGPNCKPKDVREKLLHDSQLQIFYVNYALQITNVTSPFQEFGQSYFWKQSKNSLKNINVYFRNTYLESTEGIIAPKIVKYNKLFYSFDREQILSSYDNTLFEIYLNLEKNKESHYYRKYLTLTQAFSQIGGLFNFLLCIGAVFCRPVSKIIYKQKLLNQIFAFKKDDLQIQGNDRPPNSPDAQQITSHFNAEEDAMKNIYSSNNKLFAQQFQRNSGTLTKMANSESIKQAEAFRLDLKPSKEQSKPTRKIELTQQQQQSNQRKTLSAEQCFEQQQSLSQELTQSKTIQKSLFQQSINNTQSNKLQKNLIQSINDQVLSLNKKPSSDQNCNEKTQKSVTRLKTISFKGPRKNTQDQQKKSYENYLNQLFNKSDNQFYISFTDIIKSLFSSSFFKLFNSWRMSPKSKMIEYGLSKLNQHLEINYIIDKLLELEKLKKLLLNSEQIRLFNLVPKPDINEQHFKYEEQYAADLQKSHIFLAKNKNLQEKIIDAQDAFNQLMMDRKGDASVTNKKLLELLDPKLLIFLGQNSEYSKQISQRLTYTQQQPSDDNKNYTFKQLTPKSDRNYIITERNNQQDYILNNIIGNDLLINLNVAEETEYNEEFKTPKPFLSSPNNKAQIDSLQLN